jgi:hypothetical protein
LEISKAAVLKCRGFSFVDGVRCSKNDLALPAKPMISPVFWAIYLFLPIEKFRVNFDLRHARMRPSQTYPSKGSGGSADMLPKEELAGGPNKINSNNRAAQ